MGATSDTQKRYPKCRALRLLHFEYRARIPPLSLATHRISADIRNFPSETLRDFFGKLRIIRAR